MSVKEDNQMAAGDESFFQSVVESLGMGLHVNDATGRPLYANPAGLAYFELDGVPVPLEAWSEHFELRGPNGQPVPEDETPVARGLRGEYLDRLEMSVVPRRGGAPRFAEVTTRPFMRDGRVTGVVVAFQDITRDKAAELEARVDARTRTLREEVQALDRMAEALRHSEERFRLVAFATSDAVWDWDFATDEIWWNEGLKRLFMYDPGDGARNLSWWEAQLHPEDLGRVVSGMEAAIAGEAADWEDQYRFRRGDGSYVHVFDRGYIVRDAEGRGTRMVGSMLDITDRLHAAEEIARRQAELEQVRQLDRLRNNFVNSVTHELRTPLTSILGYAEFLEDRIAGPLTPEQEDFVGQIARGARRLEYLINDLLDFARLEAGTFRLRLSREDLADKAREVVESLRPQCEQARVALTAELPEALALEMDGQRIGQVLTNLVGNAIKFTPAGGQIHVTARVDGGMARCEVCDTGPGIAAEDLPRLFKRFSQLERGARLGGGTGLGLSISKAIVESHGGAIGVESAPGRGSTFWFTLPLSGQAASGPAIRDDVELRF